MYFLNEIKPMILTKKQSLLPINMEDKLKGSLIYLLSPNYESALQLTTHPLFINRSKSFQSYYIDKDVSYYINSDNYLQESVDINNPNNIWYPDNYTDIEEYCSYIDSISNNIDSDIIEESMEYTAPLESSDIVLNDTYLKGRNSITLFKDALLNEDAKYDNQLRKLLYKERLKTNKEVFELYKQIKTDNPKIMKTFVDLKLYKGLNLFSDLSYYTKVFFKNNFWKAQRAVELYFDFMTRLINDTRYNKYGYKVKTIFIPVLDWYKKDVPIWDFTKGINPISCIVRLAKTNPELVQKTLSKFNVIFIGVNNYFRVDFSDFDMTKSIKFINLIKRVIAKDSKTDDENEIEKDSPAVIVSTIVDKIEQNSKSNIKIHNLTGSNTRDKKDIEKTIARINNSKSDKKSTPDETAKDAKIKEDEAKKEKIKKETDALVDAINVAAASSFNVADTVEKLDNDENVEKIIDDIITNSEEPSIKMSATRAARMTKLNDELMNKKVKNTSIKNLMQDSSKPTELKEIKVPVDSINSDWEHIKYANFNKQYDLDADIVAIIESFNHKTSPVATINIEVENTSTSEDLIETWSLKCEDVYGQRFSLKFDIPLLIEGKFMKLRGNMKALQNQLLLLPIIKTDDNTAQIVSNYNKIFVRRYNTNTGKSNPIADRIIKTLLRQKFSYIKITEGNNTKVSKKYHLPIDYIDIGSVFSTIESTNYIFYFNQDNLRKQYKCDDTIGIPVGYDKKSKTVLYYNDKRNKDSNFDTFSSYLLSYLYNITSEANAKDDKSFILAYENASISAKYTYSVLSILNTEIPTIVVMGYSEGLTSAMSKASIQSEIRSKRDNELLKQNYDVIRFNDGFLYYKATYESLLLMNGLKACDTENYSIADVNNKSMWLDFLDNFGGRIKADGLDNFYDLMIDPITANTCKDFDLPTDYVTALAYANALLVDNKFNKHTDLSGNKLRYGEIIAGYTYKALAFSYGGYKNQIKRGRKVPMTIKQSAIIDLVMLDPTMSDASILSPLLETETANTVTFKGLSGLNSERSYNLEKRTFDESMINVLGMSTGFAANVGMTRQATIDMNVENTRGYLKTGDTENMGSVKSLCMTEAVTPFGSTHDDPFRTAMTYIQTSKHAMRVKHSSPALITNGADEALPYLTTDTFAHKAKYKGKVEEVNDDYMIIKYDNGEKEFIDLRERTEKNSDGGFYVSLKLDTDFKKGQTVKPMDILAYDKLSYSDQVGPNGNLGYNLGTLAKVAIITTDEGYEDSTIISDWMTRALSSDVITCKPIVLPKTTNVLYMVKKGQPIQEGENLILFQNSFDEDEMNQLMKVLAEDDEEENNISDLGRIPVKSKNTGVIQDIKIYRTVDENELSPSLKKICKSYESSITKLKKAAKGCSNEYIVNSQFGSDEKLEATGKLKKAADQVMIEFYIKYQDDFSVGDKLVTQSALKGVCKDMFPVGKEPYSEYRKNEPIDLFLSTLSPTARMVCSINTSGAINKILIELSRQAKDIMGIPYKENVHGDLE